LERMLNRLTAYLRATPARKTKQGAPPTGRPTKVDPTNPRSNQPTHVLSAAMRRSAPDARSP
jgi:hypothetical protein